MKVIFICTGNIFRSASAEYLFKKYVKDMKDNQIEVSSAGIAVIPLNFYKDTKERLEFYGLDISHHKQTQVTKEVLIDKNLIICMTKQHMDYIINLGFSPILFNNIAYGNDEDLLDDCEYVSKFGHLPNEKEFIYHTIDYINDGIPNIYKWIKKQKL
jgi:protein-tyrosine phosphatase